MSHVRVNTRVCVCVMGGVLELTIIQALSAQPLRETCGEDYNSITDPQQQRGGGASFILHGVRKEVNSASGLFSAMFSHVNTAIHKYHAENPEVWLLEEALRLMKDPVYLTSTSKKALSQGEVWRRE